MSRNKSSQQINKIYRSIGIRIWLNSQKNVKIVKLFNICEYIYNIFVKRKQAYLTSNLTSYLLNMIRYKLKRIKGNYFFFKIKQFKRVHKRIAKYQKIFLKKIKRKIRSKFKKFQWVLILYRSFIKRFLNLIIGG